MGCVVGEGTFSDLERGEPRRLASTHHTAPTQPVPPLQHYLIMVSTDLIRYITRLSILTVLLSSTSLLL